jgi:hypothetical protein
MAAEREEVVPFKDLSSAAECEEVVVLLDRFAAALDVIRKTLPRRKSGRRHADDSSEPGPMVAVAAAEELRAAVETARRRLAAQALLFMAGIHVNPSSHSEVSTGFRPTIRARLTVSPGRI